MVILPLERVLYEGSSLYSRDEDWSRLSGKFDFGRYILALYTFKAKQ